LLTREICLAILFSASFHVVALTYSDNNISEVGDNIDNIVELHLVSEMQPSLSKTKIITKPKKTEITKQTIKKVATIEPALEKLDDIQVSKNSIVDEPKNVADEDNRDKKEDKDNDKNEEDAPNNASSSVATVRKHQDKGYTIPKPDYPNLARRKNYEGVVKYRVILDDQLKIKDIILISSSGYNILDRAAKKSIKRGKFIAKVNEVDIAIRFRLTDVF